MLAAALALALSPAAAQEPDLAARLAVEVASRAVAHASAPVVVAVERFETAGLAPGAAARWLEAEHFFLNELARGGTVVPVLGAGETPRLRLGGSVVGAGEGFRALWRLSDASSGRLLGSGDAAWSPLPPPPAAAAPAPQAEMGWASRPLLAKAGLPPVFAGGGIMEFGGRWMPSAFVGVRGRGQDWEAAFEYVHATRSGTDHLPAPPNSVPPFVHVHAVEESASSQQFRVVVSRFLNFRSVAVPRLLLARTPWWLRLGAGYGLHRTRAGQVNNARTVGLAPTAEYRSEVRTTRVGSLLVLQGAVGKRFGEVFELSAGVDYAVGETDWRPTAWGFGVQPFARAAVRVF